VNSEHRKRFAMTDGQWNAVCLTLKPETLPAEARERVDHCIDMFRLFDIYDEADRNSHDLLKQISESAAKLASRLERLGERECFAIALSDLIHEEMPNMSTEYRQAHVSSAFRATIDQLIVISEWCSDGSEVDFSKRRNSTHNLDRLLISLDYVLQQFTSLRVSRARAVMDFVKEVCALADPKIGAIELAISRLQRCGKFPKKQSSKVTA
jgi:hypothetical protein